MLMNVVFIDVLLYSQMARTSSGLWKFVVDIHVGSSSHRGIIIAPVLEVNGDNLGISFVSFIK